MRTAWVLVPFLLFLSACSEELWVPASEATISLGVSGGFAGVAWGVTIDGGSGTIIGDGCERQFNCDWQPGETLGSFDDSAWRELGALFAERGFLQLEDEYGVECCDQFYYVLNYSDQERQHSVAGSEARLPQAATDLVTAVIRFVDQHRSTVE
jgi:hypothetical protein